MSESQNFNEALKLVKIPILTLDQKWHRLFALGGKPQEVLALEQEVNNLLKRQAELKQELKDLKKVKETLMASVMSNMDSTSDLISKKLDEDKRLLEECKERIESDQDELLDIPNRIKDSNEELMLLTMTFCYDKLRTNTTEAEEISTWINDVRIQLKKNVIRKHNREINNKEIYSYMHDVFGMDVLNLFDISNNDFLLNINNSDGNLDSSPTKAEADAKISNLNLEDVDLDSIANEKLSDDSTEENQQDESKG